MVESPPIRVLLVDDHELLLEVLRSILGRHRDLVVVATAATSAEALAIVARSEVDVVVLDVSLPDVDGMGTARALLKLKPNLHVLALSAHHERQYVDAMLAAGACGYVTKVAAADELALAVRRVHAGSTFFSAHVGDRPAG